MYNAKAVSARMKASVCATMNFMAVVEVGRAPIQALVASCKKNAERSMIPYSIACQTVCPTLPLRLHL
jgi:hypothetical protein